jgi:hypothetical protein
VAAFWIDEGTASARELSLDFAIDLMDHGALAIVCGGTGAEAAARLFESAVEAGEFVRGEGEEIGIRALPTATLEQVLWTAAEEAMPPDAYADQPWDIVVWARSGDARLAALKEALPRLSEIVEEIYDQGGEDE